MKSAPLVGAVVVNHNGGALTIRCLESLLATEWPAGRLQVVLVDNDSADHVVRQVRERLRAVSVVETGTNKGFGAGCNAGIGALERADHIALVNSDATVEPRWLAPLVSAVEGGDHIGAASPKILFDGSYLDMTLSCGTHRHGRGDRRDLGVRISGVRVDGCDAWGAAQFVHGFWGVEHDPVTGRQFQWTNKSSLVRFPAREDGSAPECSLELSSDRQVDVLLRFGTRTIEHTVGPAPSWFVFDLEGVPRRIINNVGTILLRDGYGADRGYMEPDDGRYDKAEDVFAWCGAGVLLSREYLEDVGTFDERYFVYYEDLDLAWRGRARGWRHRYVPDSELRHVHSASTVEGSRLFDHYVERNRLLTLVRNGPPQLAANAALRHLLITGSYFRRDVVAPIAAGRRPSFETVTRRLRSLLAFLRLTPRALLQRRRLRAAQCVPDDELVPKW